MELPKVLHPMLEELKPSVASSVKSNDCFLKGRKKRQGENRNLDKFRAKIEFVFQ